jgi:hypothetical protein
MGTPKALPLSKVRAAFTFLNHDCNAPAARSACDDDATWPGARGAKEASNA